MKNFKTVACLAVVSVLPTLALADDAASSDPAFVVGRPGQAESPIAVPKGYLQVESGLAAYTNNPALHTPSNQYALAQTSFRYGILDGTDVQLVVSPYTKQTVHTAGAAATNVSGFGNTTLRVLHTFMGADGSSPAFGVIGFVTLPTADSQLKNSGVFDNRVEGGAIATGSMNLNDKTSLTLTLADDTRHPTGAHYLNDVYGAVNLSYAVTDTVGVYGEMYADHTRTAPTVATADFGVTYLTDKTTQLDAEVNLAANKQTPDAVIMIGWSHRF